MKSLGWFVASAVKATNITLKRCACFFVFGEMFFFSYFIGAALNCLSPVWYFITFHSISTNGSFKYNGHRIDFSQVNDLVFASSFE